MKITPSLCYDIYHMLQFSSAMSTWILPSSEVVDFVVQSKLEEDCCAWVESNGEEYYVKISKFENPTLPILIETIAHEMIHIRRHLAGDKSWDLHDKKFDKMCLHLNKHLGLIVV